MSSASNHRQLYNIAAELAAGSCCNTAPSVLTSIHLQLYDLRTYRYSNSITIFEVGQHWQASFSIDMAMYMQVFGT